MADEIPVIGAVLKNDEAEDFYQIMAWLRDSANPAVRHFHPTLVSHMDGRLMAAVLLRHHDGEHELVLLHDHLIKRFRVKVTRRPPTWSAFMSEVYR